MSIAFKEAVEAGDMDRGVACLAPEVTFRSPVVHTPYEGIGLVSGILRAAFETFEDFEYVHELDSGDDWHALIFRARVGDKRLDGIDLVHLNADGLIDDFTVMVRLASGLMALAEQMGPKVEALKA